MYELSAKECVLFGWNTFKQRPWIFISAALLLFGIGAFLNVPQSIAKTLQGSESVILGLAAFIVCTLLSFLLSMGKTAFYLRAHDQVGAVRLADLWHPRPYIRFAAASMLAGILTILGFILLILPGIIVGIIVGFTSYIVIDRGLSPLEALRESARITKGNRWNLFVLGAALLGINILGFCAFILGLLITMPISTLAIAHAYRQLSGEGAPAIVSPI